MQGADRNDARDEHAGAIMFSDICNSTTLFEDTGDHVALEMIGAVLDRASALVERLGGRVVRSKGDDLLCTFSDPDDGIHAARQLLLMQFEAGMQLHMGLHWGRYIAARGDIFGDAVNTASRLLSFARPEEGIVSAALAGRLSEELFATLQPLDPEYLRGKADATMLYRLVRPGDQVTGLLSELLDEHITAPARVELELTHGEQRVLVDESRPSLRIGRGEHAELKIVNRRVSRAHAIVSVHGGRVRLTDSSTLGTWVVSQQNELQVRRESVYLVGSGRICLGARPAENVPTTVHYKVTGKA